MYRLRQSLGVKFCLNIIFGPSEFARPCYAFGPENWPESTWLWASRLWHTNLPGSYVTHSYLLTFVGGSAASFQSFYTGGVASYILYRGCCLIYLYRGCCLIPNIFIQVIPNNYYTGGVASFLYYIFIQGFLYIGGAASFLTYNYSGGAASILTYNNNIYSGGATSFYLYRGCCLIPLCIDGVKDVNHFCPTCNCHVGTFKRL